MRVLSEQEVSEESGPLKLPNIIKLHWNFINLQCTPVSKFVKNENACNWYCHQMDNIRMESLSTITRVLLTCDSHLQKSTTSYQLTNITASSSSLEKFNFPRSCCKEGRQQSTQWLTNACLSFLIVFSMARVYYTMLHVWCHEKGWLSTAELCNPRRLLNFQSPLLASKKSHVS